MAETPKDDIESYLLNPAEAQQKLEKFVNQILKDSFTDLFEKLRLREQLLEATIEDTHYIQPTPQELIDRMIHTERAQATPMVTQATSTPVEGSGIGKSLYGLFSAKKPTAPAEEHSTQHKNTPKR